MGKASNKKKRVKRFISENGMTRSQYKEMLLAAKSEISYGYTPIVKHKWSTTNKYPKQDQL